MSSLVRTPAGSGKAGIWVPAEAQGVVWKNAAIPTGFQAVYLLMFFSLALEWRSLVFKSCLFREQKPSSFVTLYNFTP